MKSPSPSSPSSSSQTMPPIPSASSKSTDNLVTKQKCYMDNFENIIADGKEPIMTKQYKPKVAYQVDKQLNPQLLKQYVLNSEKVRKLIAHYAETNKCPPKQMERQIKEILDEIGLDRNLAIIRWCGIAITRIGKRISTGIYVNSTSIDAVKKDLGRNPVLYLPSHRSYLDFILMSYICFHYEIEIPGIAAGMDFHSMFGIGTMLRKTGAIFMRRSFSSDELYWEIFREYIYALIAAYHIGFEFFIEGTRSRNFKSLVPKIGVLSMALLPYFTGEVSDITIVPVSVSYERVLEEQLFVYELLGVPKPKETTKGFFKALKIIDENFGKMYMDFGAPISAREFFGEPLENRMRRASIAPHLQQLNKREIELVKKLANEVVYQQQRNIVIGTFNLLSLYYAKQLYIKRSLNIDELASAISKLKDLFEELGAHVSAHMNGIKPDIIEAVEIHSNIVHFHNAQLQLTQVAITQLTEQVDYKRLKAHALTPQTMAVAVPALALQLYINPCLFWLARPAYLILAARQMQLEQSRHDDNTLASSYSDVLRNLSERVLILDNIFRHEFIVESSREAEEFERNLKLLQALNIISICPNTGKISVYENDISQVILSALAPFLCIYYQLAVTLNEFPSTSVSLTAKDVLIRMQERVENLLQEDSMSHVHPYCLALDNLNIALYSFTQGGYLLKNKDSTITRHSTTKSLSELETQLLQYCQLMPFTQYYDPSASQQRQLQSMPSKL